MRPFLLVEETITWTTFACEIVLIKVCEMTRHRTRTHYVSDFVHGTIETDLGPA